MPKQRIAGWDSHWVSIESKPQSGQTWYYGVRKGHRVFPLSLYSMAWDVREEIGGTIVRWAGNAWRKTG